MLPDSQSKYQTGFGPESPNLHDPYIVLPYYMIKLGFPFGRVLVKVVVMVCFLPPYDWHVT